MLRPIFGLGIFCIIDYTTLILTRAQLKEATNAALAFTKHLTSTWNSRIVGSIACLEAGEHIYKTLNAFCDNTFKEEFDIHPGSFLGQFKWNVVLFLISFVLLLFSKFVLAVIPITIGVVITIFQFFYYKELIDPFFPKKKGLNVYGLIEPTGTLKQQIIFSAHHDSAHIFNHYERNPEKFELKILAGAASQFGMFILSWVFLVLHLVGFLPHALFLTGLILLAISSLSIYTFWTFYDKNGSPGAGDNISSLAGAIEIGKYFSKNKKEGKRLKHTRIIIGSWDGEEAGLRGARRFVSRHKNDLLQTQTYNFNLECMFDHQALHFLTSDLNGFVPLSKSMVEYCIQVSNKLGHEVKEFSFPLLAGGTDAAEFAKEGIDATTLVAMKWSNKDAKSRAYHTSRDTIEAVDSLAVEKSIEIGVHFAIKKDEIKAN